MSARNCPFKFVRPERSEDERRRDRFVKFEKDLRPGQAGSPKTTFEILKLSSIEPEDILYHLKQWSNLVSVMGFAEGQEQFSVFRSTISDDIAVTWSNARQEHQGDDAEAFDHCIDYNTELFLTFGEPHHGNQVTPLFEVIQNIFRFYRG